MEVEMVLLVLMVVAAEEDAVPLVVLLCRLMEVMVEMVVYTLFQAPP
jgi:hypothetical protein